MFDIEGDFHNEEFGSNFRFQNIDVYLPGAGEINFVALSDQHREVKAEQKSALNKPRADEYRRVHVLAPHARIRSQVDEKALAEALCEGRLGNALNCSFFRNKPFIWP